MAQEYFKLGGVKIRTPDTFKPNFETTSTTGSGRNQYLTMAQTPIGTISSYTMGWDYLTLDEMATIMQKVIDQPNYTAHYCDPYVGGWKDATFYSTGYSCDTLTLKDGKEMWKDFSFNMIRITKL